MEFIQKIMCKIGLHSWGKATFVTSPLSHVRDYRKRCMACGKIVKWIEEKI